jgi:hypothetical protein
MHFPTLRRSRQVASALALASAALALTSAIAPSAAHAACDETYLGLAKHTRAAHASAAPLVVGDSTLLLAAPRLAQHGISADAHGCRQFDTGVEILSAHRHAHDLPTLAVLALGANGPVDGTQIGHALAITGPKRVLGLVTPVNSATTRAAMRRAAQRHPKRVLLIDWAGHAAGHPSWFIDGLHPSHVGAAAFAHFITKRLQPTQLRLKAAAAAHKHKK